MMTTTRDQLSDIHLDKEAFIVDLDDLQAVFNEVCHHLSQQGKRAWNDVRGTCQYTTDDGLHCAVGGILQPWAQQLLLAQGRNQSALRSIINPDAISENASMLLTRLQGAHDYEHGEGEDDPEERPEHDADDGAKNLRDSLRRVAEQFDLDDNAVNNITNWETR